MKLSRIYINLYSFTTSPRCQHPIASHIHNTPSPPNPSKCSSTTALWRKTRQGCLMKSSDILFAFSNCDWEGLYIQHIRWASNPNLAQNMRDRSRNKSDSRANTHTRRASSARTPKIYSTADAQYMILTTIEGIVMTGNKVCGQKNGGFGLVNQE